MKICYACQNKSFKLDKITEEAIIDKQVVGWKVKRGEYASAPNDVVPFLIGIRPKTPKKYDTKAEISLGSKCANRWIFYWAANCTILCLPLKNLKMVSKYIVFITNWKKK